MATMKISVCRLLAGASAALVAVGLTGAASVAGAAERTPRAAPAGAAVAAVPDGFVQVADDSGTIAMAVPESWQVHTSSDSGQPTIVASPGFSVPAGCDVCGEVPHSPSLEVIALPFESAEASPSPCGAPAVIEFDNGSFTGYRANGVGCDADVDEVHASEVGGNLSIFVSMVYSSVDEVPEIDRGQAAVLFDSMLASIVWAGAPIPTPSDVDWFPVFPYETFGGVPQLGTEPVLGTGCGADGSIGETIPDGIWAGFVDAPAAGQPMSVDLLCVFTPTAAAGIIADGTATMLAPDGTDSPDPDYLIVNNNERERMVPTSPEMQLRDAVFDGDLCVEGPFLPEADHTIYQAWINIDGGQATWVIWGCDSFGSHGSEPVPGPTVAPSPNPTTAPAPSPTTAPTPPADPEAALLLADCTLLQTTVWEGDQFSGVEYPADGEPFTDSLRFAIEVTRDFFTYEAAQMQSQLAISAFAQYYAEWDSLLQAGIYTSTNIDAVTQAGWAALAPLQSACAS